MPISLSPSGVSVSTGNRRAHGSVSAGPTAVGADIGGASGDVSGDVGVGVDPSKGTVGVSPTVQIGKGPGATIGRAVGGTVGSVVAAAPGALAGSAVFSATGSVLDNAAGKVKQLFGGNQQAQRETKERNGVVGSLFPEGLVAFPDGSNWEFGNNGAAHSFSDPTIAQTGKGRDLHSYESDYTNNLDYVSAMAGLSASRLLAGGSSKAIDQAGSELGNAFLGKVGYNGQLTPENFNSVITNARSFYAQKGIGSKEEMLSLASTANSQGRLSDPEYAAIKQTAGMVFDKDFNLATQLMSGRLKGLQTAAQTPAGSGSLQGASDYYKSLPADQRTGLDPRDRPGQTFSPSISPEEAFLSVQPLLDRYRQLAGKPQGNSFVSDLATAGLGISALAGLNKLTGGSITSGIKSGASWLKDLLGTGSTQPNVGVPNPNAGTDVRSDEPVGSTSDVSSGDVQTALNSGVFGDSSSNPDTGGDNFHIPDDILSSSGVFS